MYIELQNQNDFNEIIKQDKLTIVDFFATWCGPCRMLTPELHELSEEHPEYDVLKIDVDQFPQLAGMYNIRAVPTLIFFKGSRNIHQISGYMDKTALEEIASNLNNL